MIITQKNHTNIFITKGSILALNNYFALTPPTPNNGWT